MRLPQTKIEIVPGGHRFLGKGCEAITDEMLFESLSKWLPSEVTNKILSYFDVNAWDGLYQFSSELKKQIGLNLKGVLKTRLSLVQYDGLLKVFGGIDESTSISSRKYNSITSTFNLCLRTLLHIYSIMKGSNDFVPFVLSEQKYVSFPDLEDGVYYSNTFTFSYFYEKNIPDHYCRTKLHVAIELLEYLGFIERVGLFLPEKENKYSRDLTNYCKSVAKGKPRKSVNCNSSCYRLSYEMEQLFDNIFYVAPANIRQPQQLQLSEQQLQKMSDYKISKLEESIKRLEKTTTRLSTNLTNLDTQVLDAIDEDAYTALILQINRTEIAYTHFKSKLQEARNEYENIRNGVKR